MYDVILDQGSVQSTLLCAGSEEENSISSVFISQGEKEGWLKMYVPKSNNFNNQWGKNCFKLIKNTFEVHIETKALFYFQDYSGAYIEQACVCF